MRFKDTNFNFRLLMGAAVVGLIAGGATAQEQDASDESEARQETVVVTGFRQSLQQAIAIKRNESAIVDAISAEDIADFPDLNLAESLQRIPGVSSEWTLGHVRAGKDEVVAEVASFGFELVEFLDVPGMSENWIGRFAKR